MNMNSPGTEQAACYQHVEWQMEGHRENSSFYDKDGKKTVDGGPGMRYVLEKKIRIASGPLRFS